MRKDAHMAHVHTSVACMLYTICGLLFLEQHLYLLNIEEWSMRAQHTSLEEMFNPNSETLDTSIRA